MIESRVLGPKTGPERQAGYQTNIPPTMASRQFNALGMYNTSWSMVWIGCLSTVLISITVPLPVASKAMSSPKPPTFDGSGLKVTNISRCVAMWDEVPESASQSSLENKVSNDSIPVCHATLPRCGSPSYVRFTVSVLLLCQGMSQLRLHPN